MQRWYRRGGERSSASMASRKPSHRRLTPLFLIAAPILALGTLGAAPSPAGATASGAVSPCDQASLQTLIDAGGTITFGSDCHLVLNAPLTVPSGDTVTLSGAGHSVILDGQDPVTKVAVQILQVQGASLTLEDLTITNGYAVGSDGANGGYGDDNTTVPQPGGDGTPGTVGQPGQGGGLSIESGATVAVSGVTFTNDNAAGGVGGNGGGGGGGGCPLDPNTTDGCYEFGSGLDGGSGADGASGGVGQGGAVYNNGTLTITNSSFTSDTASGGSGGSGGGGGSGGDAWGQGFSGGDGSDAGSAGDGGDAQGGAIYSTGTLKVQNSRFTGDAASAGPGGTGGDGGYGGYGYGSITGPTAANGGNGGDAGDGGNGGNATGGAIWDAQNSSTLTALSFSGDTVAPGVLGDCNAVNGAGCGGSGGPGGLSIATSQVWVPGTDGSDGQDGANGTSGSAASPDATSPSTGTPLVIKTKSLPKSTFGRAYSKALVASGGTAPYQWSVSGLPAGLSSSVNGIISGTPLAVGTFTVALVVTDPGNGAQGQASLPLTVKGIKPTITLQPANASAGAGTNATFAAGASGAPTPTVQWEVSTDKGLVFSPLLDQTTDMLTLTAVTAAQNGYKYKAVFTNAAGSKSTKKVTLTVPAAAGAIAGGARYRVHPPRARSRALLSRTGAGGAAGPEALGRPPDRHFQPPSTTLRHRVVSGLARSDHPRSGPDRPMWGCGVWGTGHRWR